MKKLTGWQQATQNVKTMTDTQLQHTWDCMALQFWGQDEQSSYDKVSMDDWAELVQSELHKRNLHFVAS